MIYKNPKKTYPAGTFIPTPARVAAILQLCVAFSILFWELSEPFSGQLFRQKSDQLLYHELLGMGTPNMPEAQQEKLKRNQERFELLSASDKAQILNGYEKLLADKQQPFIQKLPMSFQKALKQPLFKLGWLFFSILLPILLLKRAEGISGAIWILPLLTLCYAVDNQLYGKPSADRETRLFPTEKQIVEGYLQQPLSRSIAEQQAQLKAGWQRYLVHVWSKKSPEPWSLQVEEGEFAFTHARIKARLGDQHTAELSRANREYERENSALLFLYLFWNLFFALRSCSDLNPRKRSLNEYFS